MSTKLSFLAGSVVALAFALAPSEAEAAPKAKGAYGKPWRLHFETELLGVTHFDRDGGDPDDDDEWTSVGFGVARPSFIDGGAGYADFGGGFFPTFVYSRNVFALGLGYAFSRERAIVGAKFALTVDGYNLDEDSTQSAVGGRFVPYFQWMFLPESWVRPYVEVRVGFGGSALGVDDSPDEDNRATGHLIYPQIGFGGGVHLFPVDYFSVDLGLNFDYLAPHTRTTFREHPPGVEDSEWDKTGDLINFGVLLGGSVWF
jgi:hypothetical protein